MHFHRQVRISTRPARVQRDFLATALRKKLIFTNDEVHGAGGWGLFMMAIVPRLPAALSSSLFNLRAVTAWVVDRNSTGSKRWTLHGFAALFHDDCSR